MTIRDVPDDMLRVLKVRAAEAGKSLQGYLFDLMTRDLSTPTLREAVDRMRAHAEVDLSDTDITEIIDEGRARR